jgi:hypothetical protein
MSSTTNGKLERATFEFSRAGEYVDLRELQTMTGQPVERFPDVVIKELLDNGLDAAEKAGVAPRISLRLKRLGKRVYVFVRDNGCGITPETVGKILNFDTRTSDKAAYRAPTRGLQGNATKTVIGIPAALKVRAPTYIESLGLRHRVVVGLDPAGEVAVDRTERVVPEKPGTLWAVPLPVKRCGRTNFRHWARAYSLFNPHARVQILNPGAAGLHANIVGQQIRDLYKPTVTFPGEWRKFLPTDFTSPWWYDEAAFAKLVFAHVRAAQQGGEDKGFRDFVREFRGVSSWSKCKPILDRFPHIKRLSDFRDRQGDAALVLRAMRDATKPPSPDVLGEVGEDHFRRRFEQWYGVKRWWFKRMAGVADGVCYVVEAALAETEEFGDLFHGVNFGPTFDDPLAHSCLTEGPGDVMGYGVRNFLASAHALGGRTAAAFHLVWPAIETLDKGKTRLKVPHEIATASGKALWAVAKTRYAEEERRKKDAAKQERADTQRERAVRPQEKTLQDAVFEVMPEAVRNSAGALGRVSAHTLFYHVRPLIQQFTSKVLASDYFEQKLLPRYQQRVRPIPEVYYEPRGTLYEPHTGKALPLGTREVQAYDFPLWLYDKILFVEKKGLWPVFQAARLAERYDLAIVAGEGYATEACRVLMAKAEGGRKYKLAVLHDADPYGYNIARTLGEETARMPEHNIEVIDLGLRLQDALDAGLPTEEFTRKKKLPKELVLTPLEREYFEGRRAGPKSWICRRVELNAFTSPGLIAYADRGLARAGMCGKVVPPDDVLAERFRAGVHVLVREKVTQEYQERIAEEVRERMKKLEKAMKGREPRLAEVARRTLARNPHYRWSTVMTEEAVKLKK